MYRKWICAVLSLLFVAPVALARDNLAPGLDNLYEPVEGRARRASSADPNWQNGNGDCRPIPPGESLVIGDLEGPGIIRHIWFTIAAAPEAARFVSLQFFWDDETFPSVSAPLGDFFAVGNSMYMPVNSAVVEVSSHGKAYNCYWPMPFHDRARLEVHNDSTHQLVNCLFWYVDWTEVDRLPRDTRYFHAYYRQDYPAKQGENYLFLDTTGEGHYVGTVYSLVHMVDGWFGEGDDFFFIDGEAEPSLRGTGTEDYFCDAWGFRQFTQPNHGVSVWEGYETGDRGTTYRWHLQDPIPFEESLRVEIEHKGGVMVDGQLKSGFAERPDLLSSVAFWYQEEPSPPMPPLPPADQRLLPEHRIEFETLAPSLEVVGAATVIQPFPSCSGQAQLLVKPPEKTAQISGSFDVPRDGTYLVALKTMKSWDYGIWSMALDGKPVLTDVNLYEASVITYDERSQPLQLTAGAHTFTFTCSGADARSVDKNTKAPGYLIGLDALSLIELPELWEVMVP